MERAEKKTIRKATKFFEVIIGSDSGEIHSGDVPVRWCVSNGLIEDLKENDRKNVHVLFLPVDSTGREMGTRKLVPISELMTYVRFTRPGKCRLFSFLVYEPYEGNSKKLKKIFLKKFAGSYDSDIIDSNGEYHRDHVNDQGRTYIYEKYAEADVEVPEGVFGKQPSPKIRWFTNLWHSFELEDQCHFRRRFMFALIIKSWGILGYISFLFILRGFLGALAFLVGFTKVKWTPIWHPFIHETRDVLDDVRDRDNFFMNVFKIKRNRYYDPVEDFSSNSGVLISPLFLMLSLLIPTLVWMVGGNFLITLMIFVGVILIIFVGFWVIIGGILLGEKTEGGRKIIHWFGKYLNRWSQWLREREAEYNQLEDIPELICPKNKENVIQANFSDIPFKRRSVRLWVETIKNAVCKPMAR